MGIISTKREIANKTGKWKCIREYIFNFVEYEEELGGDMVNVSFRENKWNWTWEMLIQFYNSNKL